MDFACLGKDRIFKEIHIEEVTVANGSLFMLRLNMSSDVLQNGVLHRYVLLGTARTGIAPCVQIWEYYQLLRFVVFR